MPKPQVRVALAPRAQPFDESMDSLDAAVVYAHNAGFRVSIEKVRGGAPGFQNAGPFIQHMLEAGDTHLFITGDDILYPEDVIVRLVNRELDVVSGIYRKNMLDTIQPANFTPSVEEFVARFHEGGIYPTQFCSSHSMTIRRNVIEKMVADYPELAYSQGDATQYALFLPMIHEGQCYQDDWAFSVRARQSGFTLWDDYSVKLKHFCSGFLGFEQLEVQHGR